MRSKTVDRLIKTTTLETRLFVTNQCYLIKTITDLGFRDENMWSHNDKELFNKIAEKAKELTEWQLEQIKEWEEDGKP